MIAAAAILMLAAGTANPADTPARDVFIGTLAIEDGQPILTRCDLAETRYRLHDAKGTAAVADFVKAGRPAYGEVIAAYTETDGQPELEVAAIEQITPGKNCHLLDAVKALEGSAEGSAAETGTVAPPAVRSTADPAFVGHYYLSHVMETGSELLLRADGTFQWAMSYGAVDQAAHGSWVHDGSAIVLTTAPQDRHKPLFTFLEVEPWSASAETEMLRREREEKAEAVRAHCPFLTDSWTSAPSVPMAEEALATQDELREKAAAALGKARLARTRVEVLARAVMAMSPSQQVAKRDEANQAVADWMQASDDARETAQKAGQARPQLGEPVLPAACTFPGLVAVSASSTLVGGLGVRVYDLDSRQGATNVDATLRFADGRMVRLTTAGRGLAILPGSLPSGVTRVSLHADYAPGRDASFDVPSVKRGIIHFAIDGPQLTPLAFTSMRLRIDGRALVPEDFGRGRYEREP
ncbi:hypothetical protein [Novosphingobium lentum]|uniref:hypothetical protein n=1 Tax=Novosphingobium lentum TaxID=145287 RepID=UPI00082F0C0E|nr:hypothetical protein [Novosphingobium lentum]